MSSRTALGIILCGAVALGCSQSSRPFQLTLSNVTPFLFAKAGTFSVPVGAAAASPITSGGRYEVSFTAGKGQRLSFAAMFGASNDWFFASVPAGIALYDSAGAPVTGDVTSQVRLYNAGTEVDQEPGVGPDTGPKQASPTQGAADPDSHVREVTNPVTLSNGSTFQVPAVNAMIAVSLATTPNPREFKLTVQNVSSANTLQTSAGAVPVGISPGVFVVHSGNDPLYSLGVADRGQGLEQIAESGTIAPLAAFVGPKAGLQTGFSPLVYVIHQSGMPIFTSGEKDRGQGLEQIAESGSIALLRDALAAKLPSGASATGSVDTAAGASQPGPIAAGSSFVFSVSAAPGDKLSFASMLGASNDWFVGTEDDGLALFDGKNQPKSGDLSSALQLWNAGTEVDEEPGVGVDTGPNQSTPDQGAPDSDDHVRKVTSNLYATPITTHLTFTVTPQ